MSIKRYCDLCGKQTDDQPWRQFVCTDDVLVTLSYSATRTRYPVNELPFVEQIDICFSCVEEQMKKEAQDGA